MKDVTIGLITMECIVGDVDANLATMEHWLGRAAAQGGAAGTAAHFHSACICDCAGASWAQWDLGINAKHAATDLLTVGCQVSKSAASRSCASAGTM